LASWLAQVWPVRKPGRPKVEFLFNSAVVATSKLNVQARSDAADTISEADVNLVTIMMLAGMYIGPDLIPSHEPDHIARIQESQLRERLGARPVEPAGRLPLSKLPPTMTAEERAELREAVERFVRERPGEIIDLRKVK
jgi:hypothetical protein